jgi:hypothetical protein
LHEGGHSSDGRNVVLLLVTIVVPVVVTSVLLQRPWSSLPRLAAAAHVSGLGWSGKRG